MARIRSVHPDICLDDTLPDVSARGERTFVRLWTHLDDAGRCLDNPKLIKAALYPLHDDMTAEEVDADLCELHRNGLLVRYVIDGVRVLAAKADSWTDKQRPRHPTPSKLPPPPANSRNPSADGGSPADQGGETPQVVVGVGGDGVVEGEGGARSLKSFVPSEESTAWATELGFDELAIKRETGTFVDWHAARGVTPKDGQAAWRVWMTRARTDQAVKPRAGQPPKCPKCLNGGYVMLDGIAVECDHEPVSASA